MKEQDPRMKDMRTKAENSTRQDEHVAIYAETIYAQYLASEYGKRRIAVHVAPGTPGL